MGHSRTSEEEAKRPFTSPCMGFENLYRNVYFKPCYPEGWQESLESKAFEVSITLQESNTGKKPTFKCP